MTYSIVHTQACVPCRGQVLFLTFYIKVPYSGEKFKALRSAVHLIRAVPTVPIIPFHRRRPRLQYCTFSTAAGRQVSSSQDFKMQGLKPLADACL